MDGKARTTGQSWAPARDFVPLFLLEFVFWCGFYISRN